jgi:hypothetical protein
MNELPIVNCPTFEDLLTLKKLRLFIPNRNAFFASL